MARAKAAIQKDLDDLKKSLQGRQADQDQKKKLDDLEAELTAAVKADEKAEEDSGEIRHPFKKLKAGGKYLYRNEAMHFAKELRHDDKGVPKPMEKSAPVPCAIEEIPYQVEGKGKLLRKTVVNFANTVDDVVHDLDKIPVTGVFVAAAEAAYNAAVEKIKAGKK
jgi:hypothetical protein